MYPVYCWETGALKLHDVRMVGAPTRNPVVEDIAKKVVVEVVVDVVEEGVVALCSDLTIV